MRHKHNEQSPPPPPPSHEALEADGVAAGRLGRAGTKVQLRRGLGAWREGEYLDHAGRRAGELDCLAPKLRRDRVRVCELRHGDDGLLVLAVRHALVRGVKEPVHGRERGGCGARRERVGKRGGDGVALALGQWRGRDGLAFAGRIRQRKVDHRCDLRVGRINLIALERRGSRALVEIRNALILHNADQSG